jgi:CRISPR-associated protein Cmr2
VHCKWQCLADAVWREFVQPALSPGHAKATEDIWHRQIGTADQPAFWEIAWVLGPTRAGGDHLWLERRKAWRTFSPTPEPGDMCRMMGTYQELSGLVRVSQRLEQEKFWEQVRSQIRAKLRAVEEDDTSVRDEYPLDNEEVVKLLELRKSERLCAIALVKRLFPRLHPEILKERIGWLPPDHALHIARGARDNRLQVSYRPSTAFVASTHWIARAGSAKSEAAAFSKVVTDRKKVHRVLAVAERWTKLPCHDGCKKLAKTDGRLFYRSVLATKDKEPGVFEPELVLAKLRDLSHAKLPPGVTRRLRRADETPPPGEPPTVGEPSPFFAVLRMDGDHVGRLIRKDANRIKGPLAEFAKSARDELAKCNGSVIYAGGDDLLALLPLEDALPAADEVRKRYECLIGKKAAFDSEGTISASIVYAHYEASLGGVLRRSLGLLERLAKEDNGRASLALAIHRTDGAGAEWVSTWTVEANSIACDIQEIARRGSSLVQSSDPAPSTRGITSNRFVYGVRERLSAFFANDPHTAVPDERSLVALLRAVGGEAAALIEDADYQRLLRILRPRHRDPDLRRGGLCLEGLLILRFLASEWRRIEPS